MFLNKKLPEGLLNLYKSKQQASIPQTEQKKEPVIQSEMKNEPTSLTDQSVQQQKQEQPCTISAKMERKQLMQIERQAKQNVQKVKDSSGIAATKKRKNPFIKQCEDSEMPEEFTSQVKMGRKFFEYVEPQVRQRDLQEGLQSSFIYMVVGPPRSGKTRLITKLLNEPHYYGPSQGEPFFQKQIFVSPSIIPKVKLCENYNYVKSVDLFMIYNMLDIMDREYAESEQFKENNTKGHLLLVFDDCIGEMCALQKKPEFQNLFNNRRQLLISLDIEILVASQNAVGIPAFIRKISTGLFLFQVLGGQEYKTIIEENIPKKYSNIFKSVVMEYTKQELSCILIQRYPFGIYSSVNDFQKITLI